MTWPEARLAKKKLDFVKLRKECCRFKNNYIERSSKNKLIKDGTIGVKNITGRLEQTTPSWWDPELEGRMQQAPKETRQV